MYSLQAVISACKNTYNVHTDLILSDGCLELLPANVMFSSLLLMLKQSLGNCAGMVSVPSYLYL